MSDHDRNASGALSPPALYSLLQEKLRECSGGALPEEAEASVITALLNSTLDWIEQNGSGEKPFWDEGSTESLQARRSIAKAMTWNGGRVPIYLRSILQGALIALDDQNGLLPDLFRPAPRTGGAGMAPATVNSMEFLVWCWIYWRRGQLNNRRGSRNAVLSEVAGKAKVTVGAVDAWLREARQRMGAETVDGVLSWHEKRGRSGLPFLPSERTLEDMLSTRHEAMISADPPKPEQSTKGRKTIH
jgi:hypothetical protein